MQQETGSREQRSGDGNVTVIFTGHVNTIGDYADGVLAEQARGVGNVTVDFTGNITTAGRSAEGIQAERDRLRGNGDVSVSFTGNIADGPMRGSMNANGETQDFELAR